ncbi:hypothetical protein ACFYZ4_26985 [Streptomyces sp. NPDC001513]|uniref:hypothetical protein n=1 Tax=Streptomyces sp. NPDC001513 TaxID=3364580 RepID=UPI00368585CB
MTSPTPPPPCSTGKGEKPIPAYTGATMTITAPSTPRALLTDAQFNNVMHTILDNNPGMEPGIAGRILIDALAFLATAAKTAHPLVPSRVVDEGWHALILHTGLYQSLCAQLGGFVHHVPERPDPGHRSHGDIERTVTAIEAAGYTVNHDLWRGPEDSLVSVAAQCQHSGPGLRGGLVVVSGQVWVVVDSDLPPLLEGQRILFRRLGNPPDLNACAEHLGALHELLDQPYVLSHHALRLTRVLDVAPSRVVGHGRLLPTALTPGWQVGADGSSLGQGFRRQVRWAFGPAGGQQAIMEMREPRRATGRALTFSQYRSY